MAHGDAREGKCSGNWRMEWVASTLHTTSEHGVSGITTADAHTSAASSRLNWRPRLFKWTRPFRRKTKSGFCACAITFQLASTNWHKYSDMFWPVVVSRNMSLYLCQFLTLFIPPGSLLCQLVTLFIPRLLIVPVGNTVHPPGSLLCQLVRLFIPQALYRASW